jgi:hypothetical protein
MNLNNNNNNNNNNTINDYNVNNNNNIDAFLVVFGAFLLFVSKLFIYKICNYKKKFNIKNIKKIKYEDIKKNIYNNDSCTICLDNYISNSNIVQLSCKHLFHHDCILKWSEKKLECPICNKIFIV